MENPAENSAVTPMDEEVAGITANTAHAAIAVDSGNTDVVPEPTGTPDGNPARGGRRSKSGREERWRLSVGATPLSLRSQKGRYRRIIENGV